MVTEIGTNPADMQPHGQTQLDMDVLQITDYCPEWAFPEVCGGYNYVRYTLFYLTTFVSREVLRY